MPREIQGEVVESLTIGQHHFQIEKLPEPVQRGAGLRHYMLWQDGRPSYGGAWHYTLDGARRRAERVADQSRASLESRLTVQVNLLEREVASLGTEARELAEALRSALATIEDYIAYQHDGDPDREDARLMCEMDINEFAEDGRLVRARAVLAAYEGERT